jgi:hypothetical protein
MKKMIMGLMMVLMLPMVALAEVTSQDISDNFNKLPEETRIAIAGDIAKKKAQLDAPTSMAKSMAVSPTQVKEWAGVGKVLGSELNALVTELAMPIGKFLDTGVGKLAVVVVLYKILGAEIASLTFGFLFFIIMLSLWIYMFRKMCVIQSIVTEPTERTGILGRTLIKKTITHYTENSNDNANGTRFIMLVTLAALCAVSITIMF